MPHKKECDRIQEGNSRVARLGSLPDMKRREVALMDTYQILSLLFLGGTFLIALLAYILSVR